jgi:NADH-quinone oxidoreductase subunit G
LRFRFEQAAADDEGASIAAVLSPMMSCEEAWLLAWFAREVGPQATLVCGYVPVEGDDEVFAQGFTINAVKCPNRRGVERVIERFGGNALAFDEFVAAAGESKFKAAYVVGGYPGEWVSKDFKKAAGKIKLLVTHDLFATALDDAATVRIPSASWAEREGSFVNCDGLIQPFARAIAPLEGVKADGQFFYELAGETGLFRAKKVRALMAADMSEFAEAFEPQKEPVFAH